MGVILGKVGKHKSLGKAFATNKNTRNKQIFGTCKLMNTPDNNVTRSTIRTCKVLGNGQARELVSGELGIAQEVSFVHKSGAEEGRIESSNKYKTFSIESRDL